MRQPRPVNKKSIRRLWGVIVFLGLVSLAAQASEGIATGVTLFQHGQFAAAQQFFEAFVSQHPTDPSGAYYLGRLAFENKQYDQAATWFEQAVQLDSGNSEYHRWLGRTYGQQAQHAGGEGFFLARKVKTHLEKAVELNPDNIEARFDLMEYYLQAPPFLGGDAAKAKAQAAEITKRDAAAGEKAWQRCQQEEVSIPRNKATAPRRQHTRHGSVAARERTKTEKGERNRSLSLSHSCQLRQQRFGLL
jgi:tetratricopeptide (TPR) repeat protein